MRRIPNTPEYYFAGEDGHIYSKYSGVLKRLKSGKSSNGKGYLQVNIKGSKLVHRLVYQAFTGNIPIGKVISHKDGDMYNNIPSNLLCETQKENLARNLEGNFIKEWYISRDITNHFGVTKSAIWKACKGYNKGATSCGFKWRYKTEESSIK